MKAIESLRKSRGNETDCVLVEKADTECDPFLRYGNVISMYPHGRSNSRLYVIRVII